MQNRLKDLKQLDAAYTGSSINTLASYAETARTMASVIPHTTLKRMRRLDDSDHDNAKVDDDENESGKVEKKADNMNGEI